MFLPSKQRVVCLCLFSCFLRVSSFSHDCNSQGALVSWPSIPAGESEIKIVNCSNLASVPAAAASGRPDLLVLWLHYNGISHIDDTWIQNSPNIQDIRLNDNKLTSVPAFNCGAAGSEGCPELKTIDLRNNLIASVPARSFANLPKLEELLLQRNKITTLASLWIVDCPSVKTIRFNGNANLARFLVPEDSESRGLANLENLHLDHSNISSLDRDVLVVFPKLKDLSIYNTPMKTLPKFVESHPVKIQVKAMEDFVCDCSATELARNGMIDSKDEARFCGSPDYNVGKNFSQLECRETPVNTSYLPRCDELSGGVTSMGKRVSVEFLQILGSSENDVYLSRVDSECSGVSVRVLVSGSPSTRGLFRQCRLVALSSIECRFWCECSNPPCRVFMK